MNKNIYLCKEYLNTKIVSTYIEKNVLQNFVHARCGGTSLQSQMQEESHL